MDKVNPNFDNITRQFMSLERSQKPKMLVVDDEPDNLDLLYRTFRRHFNVFRAESGAQALSVLANEGEVAVIISDQRMPEMKGTEFLSKTVPQFPDTMRIILTGFTDVEDLVEAINAGQVYRYITKPWDPNELKTVVERAVQTYELLKQRTEELQRAHAQMALMETLVQVAQESESLETSLPKIAQVFSDSFGTDTCILQLVEDDHLIDVKGTQSQDESLVNPLESDLLLPDAIANRQLQVWINAPGATPKEATEYYQKIGIKAHLLIPIVHRSELLALLSLQWQQQARKLSEDELKLIHLSAQQVGLAIATSR
ncbi:response regulator [Coleofasciculus chthonoplastes]|jgi:CheY-like chemotaxis protein|uniref:response regulator n=1 Tax=Coleofasciculus TaxID=669368 RepID=UPI0032FFDE7D